MHARGGERFQPAGRMPLSAYGSDFPGCVIREGGREELPLGQRNVSARQYKKSTKPRVKELKAESAAYVLSVLQGSPVT